MHIADVQNRWHPPAVEDETVLDPQVGAAVAGLWDRPAPGPDLPPLWHWFHFLDWPPQSQVGPDGHPTAGAFLPPVDDRRRMFAGGTWHHHRPLRYGEPVRRRREVEQVRSKSGRSGELLFVTVRTTLFQEDVVCQVEDQDIVYRSGPSAVDLRDTVPATSLPECGPGDESLPLVTDERLLLRMSALTANQHRIHYDRPYVVDVEHYAGLVVHGPLLVLHLAEILRRDPTLGVPSRIEFRLLAPAYVGEPLLGVARSDERGGTTVTMMSDRVDAHAVIKASW